MFVYVLLLSWLCLRSSNNEEKKKREREREADLNVPAWLSSESSVSAGPQHPSRVYDLIGDFEIGTLHPDDAELLKKKR